jgi:hypothetical protein
MLLRQIATPQERLRRKGQLSGKFGLFVELNDW